MTTFYRNLVASAVAASLMTVLGVARAQIGSENPGGTPAQVEELNRSGHAHILYFLDQGNSAPTDPAAHLLLIKPDAATTPGSAGFAQTSALTKRNANARILYFLDHGGSPSSDPAAHLLLIKDEPTQSGAAGMPVAAPNSMAAMATAASERPTGAAPRSRCSMPEPLLLPLDHGPRADTTPYMNQQRKARYDAQVRACKEVASK